jgi:hypothetical protein
MNAGRCVHDECLVDEYSGSSHLKCGIGGSVDDDDDALLIDSGNLTVRWIIHGWMDALGIRVEERIQMRDWWLQGRR